MLLGALVDAGVPLEVLADAVAALPVEAIRLETEQVTRHGLGATRVHVHAPDSSHHRTWPDVRALLADAALAPPVRDGALAVFERLAVAEGRVHRISPEEVHFHEVGALDALADVVGVVAGFDAPRAVDRLTASPVALGSGSARGAHGVVPMPGPAVLELLAGVPVVAGPVPSEMCTPTGAALLRAPGRRVDGAAADAGRARRHRRRAAATRRSCRTSSGSCSATPDRRPAPLGPRRPRDERRRPRPAAVARRPGRPVRRRARPTPGSRRS